MFGFFAKIGIPEEGNNDAGNWMLDAGCWMNYKISENPLNPRHQRANHPCTISPTFAKICNHVNSFHPVQDP